MKEIISKEAIVQLLCSTIPDCEWLLNKIESSCGWVKFPSHLTNLITYLNIENYPFLYESEAAISMAMLRSFLTEDEVKSLLAEIEAASPDERGELITTLIQSMDAEFEPLVIPKTPHEQAEAQRLFESLNEEEKQEAIRAAQFAYSFLFAAFYQNLSMMVHGEKLTSLVAQAKAGNNEALFKAVQIDGAILDTIPFFRNRFRRARLEGDQNFCDALAYRISSPPYKGKIRHKSLWLTFSILDQASLLSTLSHPEILQICDEAGVGGYKSRIEDVKNLSKRLKEYRDFQKRGIISTP